MVTLTRVPMNSPTNGNHAEDRENSTGEKSRTTGTGTRVKNCVARRRPRNLTKGSYSRAIAHPTGADSRRAGCSSDSRRFAVYSGGSESGHIAMERQRRSDDGQRESCATAFAQAHSKINQRDHSQRLKRVPMTTLGGSM